MPLGSSDEAVELLCYEVVHGRRQAKAPRSHSAASTGCIHHFSNCVDDSLLLSITTGEGWPCNLVWSPDKACCQVSSIGRPGGVPETGHSCISRIGLHIAQE